MRTCVQDPMFTSDCYVHAVQAGEKVSGHSLPNRSYPSGPCPQAATASQAPAVVFASGRDRARALNRQRPRYCGCRLPLLSCGAVLSAIQGRPPAIACGGRVHLHLRWWRRRHHQSSGSQILDQAARSCAVSGQVRSIRLSIATCRARTR